MRIAGHRKKRPISFSASVALLAEGARFKTHEEANRHQLDCLVESMALTLPLNRQGADYLLNGGYAYGVTYETLQRCAETIDLDGVPIRTLNLEGLLPTKQTMRDKDMADRIILERARETLRARPPLSQSR